MKLGKTGMFFLFNGCIAFVVLIYSLLWITGTKTEAKILTPYAVTNFEASYMVDGKIYTNTFLRNNVPYYDQTVTISCLSFAPAYSRVYSFMGIAAEPLGWWLVFFIASAMLFFTHNPVFARGTQFILQKKFPWITMEEYFPVPWEDRRQDDHHSEYQHQNTSRQNRKKRPGVLPGPGQQYQKRNEAPSENI